MSRQAESILRAYFRDPDTYWDGLGWRQAAKLRGCLCKAATSHGISVGDVVDTVLVEAERRAVDRPAPLYVVSIGGAGSHWVGSMLGELPGLINAEEVYLPPPILDRLADLPVSEQGAVADAIHLVHAWGLTGDWSKAKVSSIVNTAHRPQMIATFRAWDPGCTVVHLVRDPRDRALSVTYRKALYRSQSAPDLDDEAYLRKKAKRTDTYLRRYMRSTDQADVELRYEEIRSAPAAAMASVCRVAGVPVEDAQILQAVFLHDADNIRSGVVKTQGNLDEGGLSSGWRTASTRDRLLMHHILAFPVDVLGYLDDDCLARDRPPVIRRPPRSVDQSALELRIRVDISRSGRPWQPLTDLSLPANSSVRLRPREPFDALVLGEAIALIKPDVVCLAGIQGMDVCDLASLARAKELVGLDIAGTGLGEEAKQLLGSIRRLQWISATDTPLEEWSVETDEYRGDSRGIWSRLGRRRIRQ